MPVAPAPQFQYALRGTAVAQDAITAQAHEQRDRDLEDFLGRLTQFVGYVPGGSLPTAPASSYWVSYITGPAALPTTPQPFAPAAPTGASGFVASFNGVGCVVAGRYLVSVSLTVANSASGALQWIELRHTRGGSTIISPQIAANPGVVGYYTQAQAEFVFDLLQNDVVTVYSWTPNETGHTVQPQSTFIITPIGGAKGDTGTTGAAGATGPQGPVGPDVTLLQSNYWFGVGVTPTTAQGTDVGFNIGWTSISTNGFTLASAGMRITPSLAGKYRVTADLSYAAGTNIAQYTRGTITHYNSAGTGLSSRSVVGGSAGVANYYAEATIDAIFDMAVGDYLVVNGAIACTTGVLLPASSFCTVVPVGGTKGDPGPAGPGDILFSQFTADVPITATTAATAQSVINPGNVTYDGTPIWLEFHSPVMTTPPVAGGSLALQLFDGNTDMGYLTSLASSVASMSAPVTIRRRFTPTAGAHNYNVRAWISPSGTGQVRAGPGTSATNYGPGYLRTYPA